MEQNKKKKRERTVWNESSWNILMSGKSLTMIFVLWVLIMACGVCWDLRVPFERAFLHLVIYEFWILSSCLEYKDETSQCWDLSTVLRITFWVLFLPSSSFCSSLHFIPNPHPCMQNINWHQGSYTFSCFFIFFLWVRNESISWQRVKKAGLF